MSPNDEMSSATPKRMPAASARLRNVATAVVGGSVVSACVVDGAIAIVAIIAIITAATIAISEPADASARPGSRGVRGVDENAMGDEPTVAGEQRWVGARVPRMEDQGAVVAR